MAISTKCYLHCLERLQERYRLSMTRTMYADLNFKIQVELLIKRMYSIDDKAHGFVSYTRNGSIWKIKLLHHKVFVYCVFDHSIMKVVTVLTKEQVKRNHIKKTEPLRKLK